MSTKGTTSLAGGVAIVTGASSGIGAEICKKLVQEGMIVVGLARRETRIQELAISLQDSPGRLHTVKCDVTKDEELAAMFADVVQQYGPVRVCVNNAGFGSNKNLIEEDPRVWRNMMDVNVVALCHLSKLAVKNMVENKTAGHIMNISSVTGHHVIPVGMTHFYSATKFAVRAITEGLRHELREMKSNIRISSISPSLVRTEFVGVMLKDENLAEMIHSTSPALEAEDVANSVLHILTQPAHVETNDIIITATH